MIWYSIDFRSEAIDIYSKTIPRFLESMIGLQMAARTLLEASPVQTRVPVIRYNDRRLLIIRRKSFLVMKTAISGTSER